MTIVDLNVMLPVLTSLPRSFARAVFCLQPPR
jgi:hypothetical protein